jgi:branched-chain amino acid transport system permease protein
MVIPQQLAVLAGTLIIMLVFAAFFRLTRAGKMMQATADNARAARLVGIRTDHIYTLAFGTGAAIAGAAAVLTAPLTLLYPDIGFTFFLKGFAAAVLGGLTSLPGAVLGGLIVGVVESLAGGYIHSSVMELSPFVVIMIVLVFKPTGLLSFHKARRV